MKKTLISALVSGVLSLSCIVAPPGGGCAGDYNCDCGCSFPHPREVVSETGGNWICGTHMLPNPKVECEMTVVDRARTWCKHCD